MITICLKTESHSDIKQEHDFQNVRIVFFLGQFDFFNIHGIYWTKFDLRPELGFPDVCTAPNMKGLKRNCSTHFYHRKTFI